MYYFNAYYAVSNYKTYYSDFGEISNTFKTRRELGIMHNLSVIARLCDVVKYKTKKAATVNCDGLV